MLLVAIHHMKMIFILQYTFVCPKFLKTSWIKHIENWRLNDTQNSTSKHFKYQKEIKIINKKHKGFRKFKLLYRKVWK